MAIVHPTQDTGTAVLPNFSHRLAVPGLKSGAKDELYECIALMVERVENRARLLGDLLSNEQRNELAAEAFSLAVDAHDIEATVSAWCGHPGPAPDGA